MLSDREIARLIPGALLGLPLDALNRFARAIELEARQQTLEEAAKACESDSEPIIDRWDEGFAAGQRSCADAIRTFKEQS